jgi:hypothetical protein
LVFNCPRAKIAEVAGSEATSDVVKVFCGPRNHDGVYPNVVFRLTYHPDGRITVVPWRD